MEGQKDVLAVVESVHPFLPLGKTLEESIAPMSPGSAQATAEAYQNASLQAIEVCYDSPFNFDQVSSQCSGNWDLMGSRRDYVQAFSDKLPVESYLFCACPFTNVPAEERNDSNAAILLQDKTRDSICIVIEYKYSADEH